MLVASMHGQWFEKSASTNLNAVRIALVRTRRTLSRISERAEPFEVVRPGQSLSALLYRRETQFFPQVIGALPLSGSADHMEHAVVVSHFASSANATGTQDCNRSKRHRVSTPAWQDDGTGSSLHLRRLELADNNSVN
jgi:hypothetical protein